VPEQNKQAEGLGDIYHSASNENISEKKKDSIREKMTGLKKYMLSPSL